MSRDGAPAATSPISPRGRWLSLAGVLDLGSRRCVGYAMDERMPTELVSRALTMAVDLRRGDITGMIFHAGRGSQYMSREFHELCEGLGVVQSVGRTGSCWDCPKASGPR